MALDTQKLLERSRQGYLNMNQRNTYSSRTSNTTTYNSRYPGFDENDYKKLEKLVDDKGLTGSQKQDTMDKLYRYYLPQVQQQHDLSDRSEILNQQTAQVSSLTGDAKKQAETQLKLSELSQQAREKFGIPVSVSDEEVINAMGNNIENGGELLKNYINNGDDELLYAAGIKDRNVNFQGGIKGEINKANVDVFNNYNELKNGENVADNIFDMLNVIGEGAEITDNLVNKYIPTVTYEKQAGNLADRINNLSDEDIAKLRKYYNDTLAKAEEDDNYTPQEIAGDIGKVIWKKITGNDEDAALIARKLQSAYIKDGKISVDKNAASSDEAFRNWLIDSQATFGEQLVGANDVVAGRDAGPNMAKFFANIPGSAVKTLTATIRGMTNPGDTIKGLYTLIATEEGHQALLNRYGSWDAIKKTIEEDPVGFADDILSVVQLGGNLVGGGVKTVGKITGNANLVNAGNIITAKTPSSVIDVAGQNAVGGIYNGLEKVAGDNKIANTAVNILEGNSNIKKQWQNTKDLANNVANSKFGQAVGNFKDEVVNKIVGLDETDRKFIQENGDLVNQYLNGEKSVDTALEEIKTKIADTQNANSEMGQKYDALRQSGQTTNTQGISQDLAESLAKNKISIDADGNLVFDKNSKFNKKQIAAIQDAWETIKQIDGDGNLDVDSILNQRQKLDDKINREGKDNSKLSSVDKTTDSIIKSFREALDNRAKNDITGLKELDAEYAPAIEELNQIKRDWFDNNGNLRDNARSKVRNLTKGGNEARLERLEKIAPGITQELKALDVALTVDKVGKQGVGQYAKGVGIGAGAGLLSTNPMLGLVTIGLGVLSTPKNFVKVVQAYPNIAQKIMAGVDLAPNEISKLTEFAARIDTVNEVSALD